MLTEQKNRGNKFSVPHQATDDYEKLIYVFRVRVGESDHQAIDNMPKIKRLMLMDEIRKLIRRKSRQAASRAAD